MKRTFVVGYGHWGGLTLAKFQVYTDGKTIEYRLSGGTPVRKNPLAVFTPAHVHKVMEDGDYNGSVRVVDTAWFAEQPGHAWKESQGISAYILDGRWEGSWGYSPALANTLAAAAQKLNTAKAKVTKAA